MKWLARLRAVNAVLSTAMLVLLALHGVLNSLLMTGVGTPAPKALALVLLSLACLHVALGAVLTAMTFRAQGQAGVSYPGVNKRFWAARASGLAIALFVVAHLCAFGQFGDVGAPYRLNDYGSVQLAMSLLLVASIAVHVATNARPLAVALGIGEPGARAADIVAVASVVLLLAAIAFIVYFMRWSVV